MSVSIMKKDLGRMIKGIADTCKVIFDSCRGKKNLMVSFFLMDSYD
jgi:hypothetical protein